METGALLDCLHGMEAELKGSGLRSLYLFGSRARGDHRANSDIDLLFETDRASFSYFDQFAIKNRLSDQFGVPVDLVERHALHARVRPFVEPDLLRVF